MQSKAIGKGIVKRRRVKWILLTLFLFGSAGSALAQNISLSLKGEPIQKAFSLIESQSNYRFIYSNETIRNAKAVTLQLSDVTLREALAKLFKEQPLTYSLEDNYVMVKASEARQAPSTVNVTGIVKEEDGSPLPAVNVRVKGTSQGTSTNENGEFHLKDVEPNAVLQFSYIGRETREMSVNNKDFVSISLRILPQSLDETIIQAYGTTTRRFSTGTISKIS